LVLLLVGIIIGLASFLFKPLTGAILTIVMVFAYFLIAMTLFGSDHLWIEIARPVLTILLTFTAVMAYRYITEEKDRKFLQSTFKQYLSPELIDIMYNKKQQPMLGGEEGVRTAFFTDIQGFSTFSEKLGSPTRLVELLNEYLSEMTDTLLKHYGTLDKYEGDAIIAFFGAPMPMDDHAYQACLTALDMQNSLGVLRKKWVSEGDKWPEIVHQMRMRIGVNTGLITTGNMGSAIRKNYTMMGDAVNLAARLESAAKQYGVYTMISSFTQDLIKDSFETRQVDKITVVGKTEPVVVYELITKKGDLDPEAVKMLDLFNEGLNYFYAQEWDKSIKILQEAHLLEPFKEIAPKGMTPSKKIIQYCEMYKSNPPGPDWDGVMSLTSK
jgi:adenylate cyclase